MMRIFLAFALTSCLSSLEPALAETREAPPYRVLNAHAVCLPCGAESHYVVIDSENTISDLHAKLVERCRESRSADDWRKAVSGLVDFREEAVVTMYEVIGTGGDPSLEISGPEKGVLKASINWHTGPPPHVPIATAACLAFAVQKSSIRRVDITPGGVLSKDKRERSLPVPGARSKRQ